MESPEFRLAYEQERASLSFRERIDDALQAKQLKRAGLAAQLGKSRSWVTQALRRGSNLTLKTMVQLAHGLGYQLELALIPREDEATCQKPHVFVTVDTLRANSIEAWRWTELEGLDPVTATVNWFPSEWIYLNEPASFIPVLGGEYGPAPADVQRMLEDADKQIVCPLALSA